MESSIGLDAQTLYFRSSEVAPIFGSAMDDTRLKDGTMIEIDDDHTIPHEYRDQDLYAKLKTMKQNGGKALRFMSSEE